MSFSPSLYGTVTRKLFKVWNERAELPNKQLVRSLPYVFHDMDVYPSRSQMHEMIKCANECSRRKNGDYLTFGEFCVYASELKSSYEERGSHPKPLSMCDIPEHRKLTLSQQMESTKASTSKFEVFLGGSCNPTTWRTEIAIPMLKNLGITYYNPQVAHWRPELIELEWSAKQSAEVLFVVIDSQTRATVSLIEAAFISGSQRKLILVFNESTAQNLVIDGEPISDIEYKDLKQGQSYLQDLVEREGIPIFDQVTVALECVARILREGITPQELSREDNIMPVRMAHIELGDKLIRLREVFDSLDSENKGEISLTDLSLAFRVLTDRELSNNNLREIAFGQIGDIIEIDSDIRTINLNDIRINFDQFCCIVTEFKSQISTNRRMCQMLTKKFSFIVEFFRRLFNWFFKPVKSALKSSQSVQQFPYEAHYRDIYLGGSDHSSSWREDIAIPLLKKNGLTYYSSQNSLTTDRMIPLEAAAIEKSRVLLFTITNTTRALSTMILAAYYVALGCNVVLCIQYLDDNCVIGDEILTEIAVKDYNRGRAYLSDMATRVGVPVFEDIREAVMSAVRKCISNNNISLNNKSGE